MSDLDKKLDGIFRNYTIHEYGLRLPYDLKTTTERLTDEITQAFIDDGWFSLGESDTGRRLVNTVKRQENLMTGQEWYDRFEQELAHIARWKELPDDAYPRTQDDTPITVGELNQAAKNAAGIQ